MSRLSPHERLRVLTVKTPWAYLILKERKLLENRKIKLPSGWIDHPVIIHASKGRESKRKREETYDRIEQMLKNDKDFWKSPLTTFDDFDKHMKNYEGKLLCVVRFIADDIKTDEEDNYNFYNIPEQTTYHWVINGVREIKPPVAGWQGQQGFHRLDESLQQKLLDSAFNGKMEVVYNYLNIDTTELLEYEKNVCIITSIIYIFTQKIYIFQLKIVIFEILTHKFFKF